MKRSLALMAFSILITFSPVQIAHASKMNKQVTVYLKKGEVKVAILRNELNKLDAHVDVYLKDTGERVRYKAESLDSIVMTDNGQRTVWESKWINQSYNLSSPVNTDRPLLVKRIWKGERTSVYTSRVAEMTSNANKHYFSQQVDQFYYGLNTEKEIRLYYSESLVPGTINLGNFNVTSLSLGGSMKLSSMAKFFPQYPVFQKRLETISVKRRVFHKDKAIIIKYLDEYLRIK